MSDKWYEILLGSKTISAAQWEDLAQQTSHYLGWHGEWQIYLQCQQDTIHYYLKAQRSLPSNLGLSEFYFKPLSAPPLELVHPRRLHFKTDSRLTLPFLLHKLERHSSRFCYLVCHFRFFGRKIFAINYFVSQHRSQYSAQIILALPAAQLLSINYQALPHLHYQKIPKSLDHVKTQKLTQPVSLRSLLLYDTFPYHNQLRALNLENYEFAKHSLVIGGSGSGKSRFLSIFADRLFNLDPQKYKVIFIDPHDAIKHDLGPINSQKIIDFSTPEHSLDLFTTSSSQINVNVEFLLETFQSLIGASYNSRLERVLRHSVYLLLLHQSLSFTNLRRLISDVEYRQTLLNNPNIDLPSSVSHFFLTEFSELRAQAYNLAFAPIIAFIDEMQMVSVFNSECELPTLNHVVAENFLTVLSLNRLQLGDKATKVVAALLLQQIFFLAEQRILSQHLILVVDEVATIENPILLRFLSEMRKYNVSIILAGQYFAQISPALQAAILANASNYYIFRVSRADAEILRQNLQLKLANSDATEDELKLFTSLKARECLVQISHDGELLPVFKARTPDYTPPPNPAIPKIISQNHSLASGSTKPAFAFSIDSQISAEDLMKANSTNRKLLQ